MRRFGLLLLLLTACNLSLDAQQTRVVSGEYVYYPPETQSYEAAKRTAMENAKIKILADTFGTVISMTSAVSVTGSSDVSSTDLSSLEVKGEWIETIGEPKYVADVTEDGMIVIKVTIKGKVREIVESKADYVAKVLRNGVEDRYESLEFQEGDDLYMSFKSPVDGYLAVYLYDGTEDVYCLLPYKNHDVPSLKVEGGERYVFFSPQMADYGVHPSMVEECYMTCSRAVELNTFYVVWSPNQIYHAVDSDRHDLLPRVLNYKSFQKWLSKLKAHDKDAVVKTMDITIRRND